MGARVADVDDCARLAPLAADFQIIGLLGEESNLAVDYRGRRR